MWPLSKPKATLLVKNSAQALKQSSHTDGYGVHMLQLRAPYSPCRERRRIGPSGGIDTITSWIGSQILMRALGHDSIGDGESARKGIKG